jgi:hypothetical protein
VAEDHSDAVGWPAKPTRVYQDSTRIGPVFRRGDEREDALRRVEKWRSADREHYRALQREYNRKHRQKVAIAATVTTADRGVAL